MNQHSSQHKLLYLTALHRSKNPIHELFHFLTGNFPLKIELPIKAFLLVGNGNFSKQGSRNRK